MFCNIGVGEDGDEEKNPGKHCKLFKFDFPLVSNRLKCSVAGRC